MRILLKPGESLTGVMSGAAATTAPTVLTDVTQGAQDETNSASLNGTSAVTLASCPANSGVSSRVNGLSICNIDTAAVTLTLTRVNASGTSYTLTSQTLQVGDTLLVDAGGMRVVNSSGQAKQSGSDTGVQSFTIPPNAYRVHDAWATNLPATAGTDDLGMVLGTDGTNFAALQSIDFKATTTTSYARAIVALPANYVDGSAITIRLVCGMLTTAADTSATIDLNVYSNDGDATGSADLCATATQSINSLTFSNKDFTITPTGLVAGQLLNIKITFAGVDSATGTAVVGAIASVALRTTVNQ